MSAPSARSAAAPPPSTPAGLAAPHVRPPSALTRQYVELLGTEGVTLAFAPEAPPGRRMVLKVGKYGDSVQRVAHRYHLSPLQVAQWNRTSERGIFRKGQFVTIYVTHTPRIFVAERKVEQRRVVAERKPQVKRRTLVRKPTKVAERQRRDLHYSVQTRDKRLIDVAQQ